jgi:hypothetical protein
MASTFIPTRRALESPKLTVVRVLPLGLNCRPLLDGPVRQRDADPVRPVDHVEVGDHVAELVNDDTGPRALLLNRLVEPGVLGGHRRDIHYCLVGPIIDLDVIQLIVGEVSRLQRGSEARRKLNGRCGQRQRLLRAHRDRGELPLNRRGHDHERREQNPRAQHRQ